MAAGTQQASQEMESFEHSKHNPYNWPTWKKWASIGTISIGEFIVPFVSMMLAPAIPQVKQMFRPDGNDESLVLFCVTVYLIGQGAGLLLFGPLSDATGRLHISRAASICYVIFTVACGLSPKLEFLIASRALAGFFGAVPVVVGGALVADLYPPEKRGDGMTIYTIGPALGPALGSVVGSLINGSLGWRWIFWFGAILAGIYSALCFILLSEGHSTTIRRRLFAKGIKFLSDGEDEERDSKAPPPAISIWTALKAPAKIVSFPSIALVLLFMAIFNGLFNILISTLGTLYQNVHHFTASTAGFPFIAIGAGAILSLLFSATVTKQLAARISNNKSGGFHNNYLPMVVLASLLACLSWLFYGWANERKAHWAVTLVGLFVYGLSGTTFKIASGLFMLGAVPGWAGCAMALGTFAQCVAGAVLPLAAMPMYHRMGLGWSYTCLAAILLVFCSIPACLFVFANRLHGIWSTTALIETIEDPDVKSDSDSSLSDDETKPIEMMLAKRI